MLPVVRRSKKPLRLLKKEAYDTHDRQEIGWHKDDMANFRVVKSEKHHRINIPVVVVSTFIRILILSVNDWPISHSLSIKCDSTN